ncbi:MAG TPA: helix-turn-helix transcriptional regulator [Ktedonobacteraceae bacterium]|nr:helix-turn-helix transcriptional regulator [Ktedonobacteraceae bacterium]
MVRLKVREVAEARGFTISGLSRKSDVSVKTVRRLWRHPETVTTTETLERLATALGVTIAELLSE